MLCLSPSGLEILAPIWIEVLIWRREKAIGAERARKGLRGRTSAEFLDNR